MILISPVIAEITDAETGSTFTLATKATIKRPDPFDLAIEDHRNKKENYA